VHLTPVKKRLHASRARNRAPDLEKAQSSRNRRPSRIRGNSRARSPRRTRRLRFCCCAAFHSIPFIPTPRLHAPFHFASLAAWRLPTRTSLASCQLRLWLSSFPPTLPSFSILAAGGRRVRGPSQNLPRRRPLGWSSLPIFLRLIGSFLRPAGRRFVFALGNEQQA
jgi:hypothetical protein